MIQITSLQKRFKKLQALNDINATFNKGQVISLIGPNGSGKTTLIKSIGSNIGNILFLQSCPDVEEAIEIPVR